MPPAERLGAFLCYTLLEEGNMGFRSYREDCREDEVYCLENQLISEEDANSLNPRMFLKCGDCEQGWTQRVKINRNPAGLLPKVHCPRCHKVNIVCVDVQEDENGTFCVVTW